MRVEAINAPDLRATVAQIYGRARKSWYLKINPVWWFMNDDEQTIDQADWYHPEWPYWRRWLYWNVFRNPLQNFRAYVVGASDKKCGGFRPLCKNASIDGSRLYRGRDSC